MKKERIAYWDNLKFLMILFVVLGHFLMQAYQADDTCRSMCIFIYSFHMPLFIFVSGVFHRNTNVRKKVIYYLLIYVLLKTIIYAVRTLMGDGGSYTLLSDGGIPWFIFALAVWTLLTWLLRNVNLKYVLFMFLLAGCFAGYDKSLKDFLVVSRILVFYPFYLGGYLIGRERIEALLKKWQLKLAAAALLIFWLVYCLVNMETVTVLMHLFTGHTPFNHFVVEYGWLNRLLCYVIGTLAGSCVMMLVPVRRIPGITEFGSRTMQVYFWHRIILYLLVIPGAYEAIRIMPGGYLMITAVAVALTVVLSLPVFRYPAGWLAEKIY